MKEIVKYFGGKTALARVLNVDKAAVSYWLKAGLPAWRAIQIERLSKGYFKATVIVGSKHDA